MSIVTALSVAGATAVVKWQHDTVSHALMHADVGRIRSPSLKDLPNNFVYSVHRVEDSRNMQQYLASSELRSLALFANPSARKSKFFRAATLGAQHRQRRLPASVRVHGEHRAPAAAALALCYSLPFAAAASWWHAHAPSWPLSSLRALSTSTAQPLHHPASLRGRAGDWPPGGQSWRFCRQLWQRRH